MSMAGCFSRCDDWRRSVRNTAENVDDLGITEKLGLKGFKLAGKVDCFLAALHA